MSRQLWGEGSLFQQNDGRWVATFYVGTSRKRVYGKTAREANTKRKKALERLRNGLPVVTSRMTFGEAAERWREVTSKALNLSDRSRGEYVSVLKRHVEPVIGHVRIEDVRPSHVEAVMVAMADKGLSPSSRHQAHKTISHVMRAAMRDGHIGSNPAREVPAPRGTVNERVVPDRAAVRKMIDKAADERLRTFVTIAAHTGLRIAEIMNLRWADVNYKTKTISVMRGKGGKSRPAILTPTLAKQLKAWKVEQTRLRLAASWWSAEGDWIITSDIGTRMDEHNFRKNHFNPLRDAVAPGVTPHGLRHAFATIGLEEGVPMRVISEQLGHSSTRITEDTYSHVTARLLEAAGEAIERAIGG